MAELHRHVRARLRDRGILVFLEAIFIGIYVYGRGRLSPRLHLLSGIPIVITGITGSPMVITANARMNSPGGFHLHTGKVVDVDPFKALFAKPATSGTG